MRYEISTSQQFFLWEDLACEHVDLWSAGLCVKYIRAAGFVAEVFRPDDRGPGSDRVGRRVSHLENFILYTDLKYFLLTNTNRCSVIALKVR